VQVPGVKIVYTQLALIDFKLQICFLTRFPAVNLGKPILQGLECTGSEVQSFAYTVLVEFKMGLPLVGNWLT